MKTLSRLVKGLGVGGAATLIDWLALALLVELAGIPPTIASIPALILGAAVQFVGCRHVVFDGAKGDVAKQIRGFALTEGLTLVLNGIVFQLLVGVLHAPYFAARPLGTFLVFVGFSFPAWSRVFEK